MESNQFPMYPQELEDDIDELSDYLFEKYNDAFNVFYLKECDEHAIDKKYSNFALIDESGNVVTQNL